MKDKIIFWLDAHLLHYCLAYYFQKKYESDLYAIIDITNRPKKFFEKQNLVNFEKVWFLHDYIVKKNLKPDLKFLSNFEKKYDLNLWQMVLNERLFYLHNYYYNFSSDEILSILEQECKLFENILETIKPDFFITKETALHHQHLFYELCKKNNIRVLMLTHAKVGSKFLISEKMHKIDNMEKLENINFSNRDFPDLQKYLRSDDNTKNLIAYSHKRENFNLQKIKGFLQFLFHSNTNIKTNFLYYGRIKPKVLSKEILLRLESFRRKQFIDKNLLLKINEDEPFILFTLNQEPERSLLIAAPFLTNQIETVRHIAKSLPIDYKLYVKEHFSQSLREWRPIHKYKQIISIPNVKLFHPFASAIELIKKSSLVITVSGTASLEAAFYGKPSIVFTEMGFSFLPSIFKINSLDELPKTIRTALKHKVDPIEIDKYVTLIDKNSFYFDLFNYQLDEAKWFYFGGIFADAEISVEKMKLFLKFKENEFMNLTHEFIKKINQVKKSKE